MPVWARYLPERAKNKEVYGHQTFCQQRHKAAALDFGRRSKYSGGHRARECGVPASAGARPPKLVVLYPSGQLARWCSRERRWQIGFLAFVRWGRCTITQGGNQLNTKQAYVGSQTNGFPRVATDADASTGTQSSPWGKAWTTRRSIYERSER